MTYQSQPYTSPEHDQGPSVERMVNGRVYSVETAVSRLERVTPAEPVPAPTPDVRTVPTELEAEVANLAERRYQSEAQAALADIYARIEQARRAA